MKVSVVVPTHNRVAPLRNLIQDLVTQRGIDARQLEILVIDSEAGVGSREVCDEFAGSDPRVRHLLADNVLAAKRNFGAENAFGEILLFLDDDMRIADNFVVAHIEAHASRNAVISSQVRFPSDWVERSNYYRYKHSRHRNSNDPAAASIEIPPNQLVAMSFSMRTAEYARIGGFDEQFRFYGGEDVEFGHRVVRKGLENRFDPRPVSYHQEVDMDVQKFARKVYRATFYGTPMVLQKAPEAAGVQIYKLTEPFDRSAAKILALRGIVRILNSSRVTDLIRKFLLRTDQSPKLFMPRLYDLVVLASTQLAVDDRVAGHADRTASQGWGG